MCILRNSLTGAVLALSLLCLSAPGGFCQSANPHPSTQGKGVINGRLFVAGRPCRKPLIIVLKPINVNPIRNTQSKPNGSFFFSSVPFGTYHLIVCTQPPTERPVRLDQPTANLQVDIGARSPSMSQKAARHGLAPQLPHGKISFNIAGIHGTTAPSGYSAGATEETSSRAMRHLSHLASSATISAGSEIPSCDQAEELMCKQAASPTDFHINFKLGIFYLAHGDYQRSIEHLVIAHEARPSDLSGSRDLALAYLSARRFSDAAAVLRGVVARHPSSPSLHLLSADAYEGEGNLQKARRELWLSVEHGASAHDFFAAGARLLEIGDTADAEQVFRHGITLYPDSSRLFMGLGIVENLQHRGASALSSFMHAVDLDPDYAPPYQFLARMAKHDGNGYPKIMQRITKFLATHPESADAHYDYALALWEHSREDNTAEKMDEIAREIHLAVGLNAKDSEYHYLLGVIDLERGHLPDAAADFQKCIALTPTDAEAHYRLSRVYRQMGKSGLSRTELVEFLRLHEKQKLNSSIQHVLGVADNRFAVTVASGTPCQEPRSVKSEY